MKDLSILLPDRPGNLAAMARALGEAGISIEGGGAWVADGGGLAHFLFRSDDPASQVLEAHGFNVVAEREAILLRLDQDRPGQLAELCGRMAQAGVNIQVQYSDHDHQLVLVVDRPEVGHAVARDWMRERERRSGTA